MDLEGFAKPSKTVRPRAVESSVSVNCETKFFPAKSQKPKENETKAEEKDLESFESFPKEVKIPKRQKKRQRESRKRKRRREAKADVCEFGLVESSESGDDDRCDHGP